MALKDQHIVVVGGSSGIGFAVAAAAAAEGARVTIASSSAAKVDAATARLGNAGAGFTVDVTDKADVERAFSSLALPKIAPEGSITLTNGMIAHRPRPGSAVSSAMAGAVEHLARGLAVELGPIRVNCVCPGLIRTEVWNSIPAESREDQLKALTKNQAIPRVGEAEEAAQAYLFLMNCGYATGQVLKVDGGFGVIP
jgi:NAD(P)-dependent dehydrogenase (short-subunit alcohol dehydrogenase family)